MTGLDLLQSDQDIYFLWNNTHEYYRFNNEWKIVHEKDKVYTAWRTVPKATITSQILDYVDPDDIRPATPDDLVRVMTAILQQ